MLSEVARYWVLHAQGARRGTMQNIMDPPNTLASMVGYFKPSHRAGMPLPLDLLHYQNLGNHDNDCASKQFTLLVFVLAIENHLSTAIVHDLCDISVKHGKQRNSFHVYISSWAPFKALKSPSITLTRTYLLQIGRHNKHTGTLRSSHDIVKTLMILITRMSIPPSTRCVHLKPIIHDASLKPQT